LHSIKNYSNSKPLKVSPEKSQIFSCDTVVANGRFNVKGTNRAHYTSWDPVRLKNVRKNTYKSYLRYCRTKCKGKAIPLQPWTGPEGSRRLRLPDFKTIGT
jgi:hypothetical protein